MIAVSSLLGLLGLLGCVGEPAEPPSLEPVVPVDDAFGGKADGASDRVMPTGPAPASFANQITLFAIPSPRPAELSWESPGKLVRRVLFNKVGNMTGLGFHRTLGHAGIRVECDGVDGDDVFFQGSMTNTDGAQFNRLLTEDRVGLGMLFDNVDGEIESAEVLEETLQTRYDNGRVSFLRIGVSAETCSGLMDYVRAYSEENVQANYGLAARPLYREGAGCSAFSISFLDLGNLIEPEYYDEWSFQVRAPADLVGGTQNPGNSVSLWRLFWLTRDWATPGEEGFDVFGWDPTLMFHSIRQMAEDDVRAGNDNAEARGRAIGLVLDRTDVVARDALLDRTFFHN